jgi:hypothetical protein
MLDKFFCIKNQDKPKAEKLILILFSYKIFYYLNMIWAKVAKAK